MEKSCLIIAGEKSGEEHALSFFQDLQTNIPGLNFFGVGGNELSQLGVKLLYHLKDFSSIGLAEVVGKIFFYLKAEKKILEEVNRSGCKAAILIDFQEFNFRMATKLQKMGVEVFYYVAPQAWAWRSYRAKKLARSIHTLFCLLPFEKKWFQERGVKSSVSISHPLLKNLSLEEQHIQGIYQKRLIREKELEEKKRPLEILLLPGSRMSEVRSLYPVFLETIGLLKKINPNIKVTTVVSSSIPSSYFKRFGEGLDHKIPEASLEEAIMKADYCLASSGTVTLTTALYLLPTLVCYKLSLLTYFLVKTFVKYDGNIALPNILHQKELFPEFVQDDLTPYNLFFQLQKWMEDSSELEQLQKSLLLTYELLKGEKINVGQYLATNIKKIYNEL